MSDILAGVVLLFVVMVVLVFLFTFPTMWLWNYLMPGLFGFQTIGFGQALAMNLLCTLLFKPVVNVKKD